ncbi:hypothetical protein MMC11_004443 [Xylographa trunciseda]|nr:hypothetical protein [Xylographa trunciseda]
MEANGVENSRDEGRDDEQQPHENDQSEAASEQRDKTLRYIQESHMAEILARKIKLREQHMAAYRQQMEEMDRKLMAEMEQQGMREALMGKSDTSSDQHDILREGVFDVRGDITEQPKDNPVVPNASNGQQISTIGTQNEKSNTVEKIDAATSGEGSAEARPVQLQSTKIIATLPKNSAQAEVPSIHNRVMNPHQLDQIKANQIIEYIRKHGLHKNVPQDERAVQLRKDLAAAKSWYKENEGALSGKTAEDTSRPSVLGVAPPPKKLHETDSKEGETGLGMPQVKRRKLQGGSNPSQEASETKARPRRGDDLIDDNKSWLLPIDELLSDIQIASADGSSMMPAKDLSQPMELALLFNRADWESKEAVKYIDASGKKRKVKSSYTPEEEIEKIFPTSTTVSRNVHHLWNDAYIIKKSRDAIAKGEMGKLGDLDTSIWTKRGHYRKDFQYLLRLPDNDEHHTSEEKVKMVEGNPQYNPHSQFDNLINDDGNLRRRKRTAVIQKNDPLTGKKMMKHDKKVSLTQTSGVLEEKLTPGAYMEALYAITKELEPGEVMKELGTKRLSKEREWVLDGRRVLIQKYKELKDAEEMVRERYAKPIRRLDSTMKQIAVLEAENESLRTQLKELQDTALTQHKPTGNTDS